MLNEIYKLEYMMRQLRKDSEGSDKNLQLLLDQVNGLSHTAEELMQQMAPRMEIRQKQYFEKKFNVYSDNAKRVLYSLKERSTKRNRYMDQYSYIFKDGQQISHEQFTNIVNLKENGYIAMINLDISHENARGAIMKKISTYLRSEHGACFVQHSSPKVDGYIYTDTPKPVFDFLNTMKDSEFVHEGKKVITNMHYDAIRLPYKDGFELDSILSDLTTNLYKVIDGQSIPGALQGLPLDIEGRVDLHREERKTQKAQEAKQRVSKFDGKVLLLLREKRLQALFEKIAEKIETDVSIYSMPEYKEFLELKESITYGANLHKIQGIVIQHPSWNKVQTLDMLELIRIASGYTGPIVITSEKSNATMHRVMQKYDSKFMTMDEIAKRGVKFFLEDLKGG